MHPNGKEETSGLMHYRMDPVNNNDLSVRSIVLPFNQESDSKTVSDNQSQTRQSFFNRFHSNTLPLLSRSIKRPQSLTLDSNHNHRESACCSLLNDRYLGLPSSTGPFRSRSKTIHSTNLPDGLSVNQSIFDQHHGQVMTSSVSPFSCSITSNTTSTSMVTDSNHHFHRRFYTRHQNLKGITETNRGNRDNALIIPRTTSTTQSSSFKDHFKKCPKIVDQTLDEEISVNACENRDSDSYDSEINMETEIFETTNEKLDRLDAAIDNNKRSIKTEDEINDATSCANFDGIPPDPKNYFFDYKNFLITPKIKISSDNKCLSQICDRSKRAFARSHHHHPQYRCHHHTRRELLSISPQPSSPLLLSATQSTKSSYSKNFETADSGEGFKSSIIDKRKLGISSRQKFSSQFSHNLHSTATTPSSTLEKASKYFLNHNHQIVNDDDQSKINRIRSMTATITYDNTVDTIDSIHYDNLESALECNNDKDEIEDFNNNKIISIETSSAASTVTVGNDDDDNINSDINPPNHGEEAIVNSSECINQNLIDLVDNDVDDDHDDLVHRPKHTTESYLSSQQSLSPLLSSCSSSVNVHIPTYAEKEQFQRSLDSATTLVFHRRSGLPLTSSPAPIRKSGTCFDFDSSLTSVNAIKKALFHKQLDSKDDYIHPKQSKFSLSSSTSGLLGNFEESVLNGRLDPASIVNGFSAEIGASGGFCPSHKTFPVTVFFYTLQDTEKGDKMSSPYLGHINLGEKGYHVPRKGNVQVTLFNPNGTVVKMFVVRYDLSDMPPNSRTFLRQRTLFMPTDANEHHPESRKWLRYLIHLRFQSTKSGRIRLHTDVRILVFRKHDLDVATMNDGCTHELRSFVQMPSNPKYSRNIKT